jgi:predicted kinase
MQNDRLTVIVLVGLPAAGKTTWAQTHYSNFNRIDGDSLKTSKKVANALFASLQSGRNTIVDATNVTVERRRDIIIEAQKFNALVYAVVFRLPIAICQERAKSREAQGGSHIPPVAFHTSNSRYVEPSLAEGFAAIVSVGQ